MDEAGLSFAYYESPIGRIELRGTPVGLSGLDFVKPGSRGLTARASSPLPRPLVAALSQLDEYFRRERTTFSVKLDLGGTPFQRQVWSRLLKVRFGQTTTYGALAEAVGRPAATRAVGGANHSNPVSIIVPCHRVVGSDGHLTGYGGGLWRKEWLLRHEQARGLFV